MLQLVKAGEGGTLLNCAIGFRQSQFLAMRKLQFSCPDGLIHSTGNLLARLLPIFVALVCFLLPHIAAFDYDDPITLSDTEKYGEMLGDYM